MLNPRFETVRVYVKGDGTPSPLLRVFRPTLVVIRPEIPVWIGTMDSIAPGNGLFLNAGSAFSFGNADFPDGVEELQLWACADVVAGSTTTAAGWINGLKVV